MQMLSTTSGSSWWSWYVSWMRVRPLLPSSGITTCRATSSGRGRGGGWVGDSCTEHVGQQEPQLAGGAMLSCSVGTAKARLFLALHLRVSSGGVCTRLSLHPSSPQGQCACREGAGDVPGHLPAP